MSVEIHPAPDKPLAPHRITCLIDTAAAAAAAWILQTKDASSLQKKDTLLD